MVTPPSSSVRQSHPTSYRNSNPAAPLQLGNYIGFSNYPNQVHRKAKKDGFHFNLMVVGESGLGKSTLVNTLFNATMQKAPFSSNNVPKTVKIQPTTMTIEESGVSLQLTIIDTPGFGDFVNNEESWQPILQSIEARYDQYMRDELTLKKRDIVDHRVHACLYFIAPTGRGLRPIDIEFMKRLHHRVNLIPIISKADSLDEAERAACKSKIKTDLQMNGIRIYQYETRQDDDYEFANESRDLFSHIPFAVIGGCDEVFSNNRLVRGRQFPWGIVEVDNPDHSDFTYLKRMLLRVHMEDLKDHTDHYLYEAYRNEHIHELCPASDTQENIDAGLSEELDIAKDKFENIFNEQVATRLLKFQKKEQMLNEEFESRLAELQNERQRLESMVELLSLEQPKRR